MSTPREPHRRTIVRGGRVYTICGRRPRHAFRTHPSVGAHRIGRRAGLVPGATFVLIVLFSVFVLGRPPEFPDDPQRRAPIASYAHYSFADFAQASR